MIDIRKIVDTPLPKFSLKTLKKHLLKAYLPYWYNFFVSALILVNVSSTCNPRRFNLSVIIFLIPLLPSSSAKVSFSNTILIPETTFYFTTKISLALYWQIFVGTLKVLSLRLLVASNPAGY